MGSATTTEGFPHDGPDDTAGTAVISRRLLVPFYLMAFFSGVAALVYEVTWARMLELTFGSTTLSAAAVIAGFMGGMGLGAWLYHLVYNRSSYPLLIYAGLELGIAVTTVLLTRTFYLLPDFFARAADIIPSGPGLAVVRFVWVFVLLVIPAALMGATFPALCTVMIRTVQGVDRHLGMIYGINTIGAAGGALLAGLVLIERVGLTRTVTAANAINVAVALCALVLFGTALGRGHARATPASEAAIPTYLPRWITGIVLFVSGFATLSYEILWFRALRFVVGNSTYALSVVLIIFLVGLGLGSLLLKRVVRRGSPERDLALCQCLVAVLALVAMACLSGVIAVPALYERVSFFSPEIRAHAWWFRLLLDCGLATITMLPATLFMGLSFPLASRLFLGDVRKLGTRVGGAYLLANLGSILGSLLAAVLLLPLFSTIGGTKVVACINLVLGGALLLHIRRRAAGWVPPVAVSLVLVAVLALVLPASLIRLGETARQGEGGGVVIYAKDGDLATVKVLEDPNDPAKKSMAVDGAEIGWSRGYRTDKLYQKQILLAHLPMVLDTRIRHTLNIGLGSGASLYALAEYPEVETLDCVEINQGVVEAARFFPESAVFDDPRVDLVVEDAVHFLLRAGRDYDLIVSDGKQDPFFSGNATLLCREFYLHALNRLTEDGIFIQWVPLGMLHSDFRINLRTFCDVFPHVEVFYYRPFSVYVLGARRALFDRPRLSREEYSSRPIHSDLAPFFLVHPSALLASHWVGKPQIETVLGEGPISTWDHLRLDFSAFKATSGQWTRTELRNLNLLLEAEAVPRGDAEMLRLRKPAYRRSESLLRRAQACSLAEEFAEARALVRQAVSVNPESEVARRMLKKMTRRRAGAQAGDM
ncbi:MAG TPA: fused MFS/spermidine synthase [Phycisphaerae bacterium]|nr:fused MFS/spermidine synthase [Phycisphaerae bacterium]